MSKDSKTSIHKRLSTWTHGKNIKTILILITVFGLGLLAGYLITNSKSNGSSNNENTKDTTSVKFGNKQTDTERIESSYKRGKERIENDSEDGKLTSEKAQLISNKIEEIYKYRKENVKEKSEAKREELIQKQAEWRSWLTANDISMRYFVGLL